MRKSQAPTLIKYGPARAADCYLDLFISHQEFNSSAAILLNNQVVSSCQLVFFCWFVLCKLFFSNYLRGMLVNYLERLCARPVQIQIKYLANVLLRK